MGKYKEMAGSIWSLVERHSSLSEGDIVFLHQEILEAPPLFFFLKEQEDI